MGKTKELFQQYREGEVSLLDATLKAREIRKECEAEIEAIKAFEYENLEKYEDYKGEAYQGYEFQIVNGRKTYDFSTVGEVVAIKENLKEAEAKAKLAFELFQKSGQKPITEDGEVLDLPKIKYGKSYLKLNKVK